MNDTEFVGPNRLSQLLASIKQAIVDSLAIDPLANILTIYEDEADVPENIPTPLYAILEDGGGNVAQAILPSNVTAQRYDNTSVYQSMTYGIVSAVRLNSNCIVKWQGAATGNTFVVRRLGEYGGTGTIPSSKMTLPPTGTGTAEGTVPVYDSGTNTWSSTVTLRGGSYDTNYIYIQATGTDDSTALFVCGAYDSK